MRLVIFLILCVLILLCLPVSSASVMSAFSNRDHLVVLCHGLNGNHKELAYLERKVTSISDCIVLNSKRNNGNLSKLGIDVCAQELVDEIREFILQHPGLFRRISLVGMSLGGLIQR